MSEKTTQPEQKPEPAKEAVVGYYVPAHDVTVVAETPEKAIEQASAKAKEDK